MNDTVKSGESLPIMEVFSTQQGEGFFTGADAYFIRLGGCDIGCHWCDTKDSWDPGLYPIRAVKDISYLAKREGAGIAVITGGEPTMHNLMPLTKALKKCQIKTHIETAGTYPLTGVWDWICLSPKKNGPPHQAILKEANEMKVVIHNKYDLLWAEENALKVNNNCKLYLQPEWSKEEKMQEFILNFILEKPQWNLSIQTHKHLGIR
ncbi:MAG TPA: 7-carboxy-7-deazaguanine synthase QueE [Flavobacteriales bacterium]|nr:7-carboxy-7-deazaguanine synthase QueE [Flavobacteriales bacterium]